MQYQYWLWLPVQDVTTLWEMRKINLNNAISVLIVATCTRHHNTLGTDIISAPIEILTRVLILNVDLDLAKNRKTY